MFYKFMRSYCIRSINFYMFHKLSSIHSYSTRLTTSNKLLLPRVNSPWGKCSIPVIWDGSRLTAQTLIPSWEPLPSAQFFEAVTRMLRNFFQWCTSAVPKLFRCWSKFAILLASAGQTIFCIENKRNTIRITLATFVFFYLFSLLVKMFAMWFIKLLLLLHNSWRLIFGSMADAAIRRVSCKYASEILFTTAT